MRLESTVEEKEILVASSEEEVSYNSTVDEADMAFVLHILSSNLYANPIESLIREYTTNGWDAQKENGNEKDPMIVSLLTDEQGSYWSIRDYGTGLSPEAIKNVFSKFGKSTKKGTDDYHGCWGLGKYSGLSYTDNVHITTWYGGKKYIYLMYKAQVGIKIDKMYESDSDEMSGTEIKVHIKKYGSEYEKFKQACKSQLAYFQNIYFAAKDIPNDYKLHVGETYRCSTLYPTQEMHLTLGEVVYPIPWKELGIPTIYAPVALRFDIGELGVIPNRESILIKENTKDLIMSKIKKVCTELVKRYNEKSADTDDLRLFFKIHNQPKTMTISGITLKMDQVESYSDIKCSAIRYTLYPKILKYATDIATIFFDYFIKDEVSYFTKKPKIFSSGLGVILPYYNKPDLLKYNSCFNFNPGYNTSSVLYVKPGLKNTSIVKLRYLFDTRKCQRIVEVEKRSSLQNYIGHLKLSKVPKKEWRGIIKEWCDFTDKLWEKENVEVVDLEKVEPTQAWLDAEKAKKKKTIDYAGLRKAEGKILIYTMRSNERWNTSVPCVFDKEEVKIKDLFKRKNLIIYNSTDTKEETSKLIAIRKLLKVEIILTAKPNFTYFKQVPNCLSYKEFMEGKNKILGKIVTAEIIKGFMRDNKYLFSDIPFISNLSEGFAKDLTALKDYVSNYSLLNPLNSTATYNEILEDMKEVVKQTRWYDYHMLDILLRVEKKASILDFIQHIKGYSEIKMHEGSSYSITGGDTITKENVDFAVSYLKLRGGFKLDNIFYTSEYMEQMKVMERKLTTVAREVLTQKKMDEEVEIINTSIAQEVDGVSFIDTEKELV